MKNQGKKSPESRENCEEKISGFLFLNEDQKQNSMQEYDVSLKEGRISISNDPLELWSINQKRFPLLSAIA